MKTIIFRLLLVFCPLFTAPQLAADIKAPEAATTPIWSDEQAAKREVEETSKFGQAFIKMVVMLAVTLLIFVVGAFLAKRYLPMMAGGVISKSGNIKILERRALSAKSCLYLVDIEGDKLLIAEFPNGGQIIRQMHYKAEKSGSDILNSI